MSSISKIAGGMVLLLVFSFLFHWPGEESHAGSNKQSRMRVVFSRQSFTAVNVNDALASAKAWIEAVGRKRGIDLEIDTETYEDLSDLRRRIEARSVELIIADALDFLELQREKAPLEPLFIPINSDDVLDEYLLITSRQKALQKLENLRGNRVVFLKTSGVKLGKLWIDSLLQSKGLGTSETFFSSVQVVFKPSKAVLPVFFGQTDACVVDRSSFNVMSELNPQLGKALEACIVSSPYLETVICVHQNHTDFRKDLIEGLAELHQEPAGQQILTVFKIGELVPYEDHYMDSLRLLRDGIDQIHANLGK